MAGAAPGAPQQNLYVLCVMHAPGLSWSESSNREMFFGESGWAETFVHSHMSHGLEFMEDPMDRFNEFVTAAPLGAGQNALLKPRDACSGQTPLGQTCKSVKLALRTVHAKPGTGEEYIHCGLPPKIWDKLWCAVRLQNGPLQHDLVDPRDVCRSNPEKLREVLGDDADNVLRACTELVDRVRKTFEKECKTTSSQFVNKAQKKCSKQTKTFFTQIDELLRALPEMPAPEAARSTQWDPSGPRKVVHPSSISGCTCAQLESFPVHISTDCRGLEMFNVSPKTVFRTPLEVVIALFHTGKGALLGELRVTQVDDASVMRLVVLDHQEPEKLQIAASGWNMLGNEGRAASDSPGTFMGTNKHRMIWVCPFDEMKEALKKERNLEHGGAKRRRTGTSLAESLVALWRRGSLHLIISAPILEYSWQMTVSPGLGLENANRGEYCGIVLDWVGDRVYHHEAMKKGVGADVLGPLRMCFAFHDAPRPPPSPLIEELNVFFWQAWQHHGAGSRVRAQDCALGRPGDSSGVPQHHEQPPPRNKGAGRHRQIYAGRNRVGRVLAAHAAWGSCGDLGAQPHAPRRAQSRREGTIPLWLPGGGEAAG